MIGGIRGDVHDVLHRVGNFFQNRFVLAHDASKGAMIRTNRRGACRFPSVQHLFLRRASPAKHRRASKRLDARLRPGYAPMLARVETASYQRFNAAWLAAIGRPAALVAKSTVTTAVMSATENSSPATNGTSASRMSKSA